MQFNTQIWIFSSQLGSARLLHFPAALPRLTIASVSENAVYRSLSYPHFELLRLVRTCPLVSVAVGCGRYSVGYSGRVL